jgi:hypothetical protein
MEFCTMEMPQRLGLDESEHLYGRNSFILPDMEIYIEIWPQRLELDESEHLYNVNSFILSDIDIYMVCTVEMPQRLGLDESEHLYGRE